MENLSGRIMSIVSSLIELAHDIDKDYKDRKNNFQILKFPIPEEIEQDNVDLQLNKTQLNFEVFNLNEKELSKMPKDFKKDYKCGKVKGSIRRRENGTYEIRCQYRHKKITASSKFLEVAKKRFIDAVNNALTSEPTKMTAKTVLFVECVNAWLKTKERLIKGNTYKEYERLVEREIKPYFGIKKLNDINRITIEDFLNKYIDQEKFRTAQFLHLILRCSLDLAVEDYHLLSSPINKIKLPDYITKKGSSLSLEDEQKIIKYCLSSSSEFGSIILILLFFGIRFSELCTIQLYDDCISVKTSKSKKGQQVITRKIPYTPVFLLYKDRISFNNLNNLNHSSVDRFFKKCLPNRHIHELRYTFITRCKECGVNPEVVMLWDGHEKDKDVKTSKVDRGYTDFSWEYMLKEAQKVDYIAKNNN